MPPNCLRVKCSTWSPPKAIQSFINEHCLWYALSFVRTSVLRLYIMRISQLFNRCYLNNRWTFRFGAHLLFLFIFVLFLVLVFMKMRKHIFKFCISFATLHFLKNPNNRSICFDRVINHLEDIRETVDIYLNQLPLFIFLLWNIWQFYWQDLLLLNRFINYCWTFTSIKRHEWRSNYKLLLFV